MQISSAEIKSLVGLSSIIFLIAPVFLILYVLSYNRKKKKHAEEKELMHKNFEIELLRAQIEVQEQTLKTISYDLHDNIGQLLSLTSVTLSSVKPDDPVKVAEKIAIAEDLTKRSIKEVKALSRLLHGEELINLGLVAAIEFELKWLQRSNLYKINFDHSDYILLNADHDKETLIFRLFQELTNNIIQHARATEILITLAADQHTLKLTIGDNGIGFNVAEVLQNKTGMGLSNIHKRAALLKGNVAVNSEPGNTVITVAVPVN